MLRSNFEIPFESLRIEMKYYLNFAYIMILYSMLNSLKYILKLIRFILPATILAMKTYAPNHFDFLI